MSENTEANESSDVEAVYGDGAPASMGVVPKRSVRVHVRVRPEVKEHLEEVARFYGVTTCPVVEAMVESVYASLKGLPCPVPLAKDVYLFADVTIQRLTYRMVRRMKDSVVTGKTEEELHGSEARCYACDRKPEFRMFLWTASDRCHTYYACSEHEEKLRRRYPLIGYQPV